MADKTDNTHISIFEFNVTGKIIGHGAYSEVTLCERYKDHKNYALKIINKEKAQRKKMVKYVLNERRVMLMLNHPHIIKVGIFIC